MKIVEVTADNYRNLNGVTIQLGGSRAFIIGENNLGKSNLLRMLDSVIGSSRLDESDFADPAKPISIRLTFELEDYEDGKFGDIVDVDNIHRVTVDAHLEDYESDFEIVHVGTGQRLSRSQIQHANYRLYDAMSADSRTLDYSSQRGAGRVLRRGMDMYLSEHDSQLRDFLDSKRLTDLAKSLDKHVQKLPLLGAYGIHAGIDDSDTSVLGSVVSLIDKGGRRFNQSGSGVQYAALAILSVLDCIARIPKRRRDETTYEVGTARILPCVLAFDEPETHLHPYMQRALVKALTDISAGADAEFNSLIKSYFNIDRISAQLIIVTHSPNVITPHYEELVRFGVGADGTTIAINGAGLKLDRKEEKQLYARFSEIREAFFCKKALVVEGETEFSALPLLAEKMGIYFDGIGAVAVYAGGGGVPIVCKLLEHFGIPAVSIIDRDDKEPVSTGPHISTSRVDFEDELVNALFESGCQDELIGLVEECEPRGKNYVVQAGTLRDKEKKIATGAEVVGNVRFSESRFEGKFAPDPLTYLAMYTWLSTRKGSLLGAAIGRCLPAEAIPECYKSVITKLGEC